jgi:hypothetical protein
MRSPGYFATMETAARFMAGTVFSTVRRGGRKSSSGGGGGLHGSPLPQKRAQGDG